MHNSRVEGDFNIYKILLIIFIVAMVLRVGLNVARQELFFHKPFLLSDILEDKFDDRTRCDSLWYNFAAKGFLAGRGILSIPVDIVDWKNEKVGLNFMKWKVIDGKYVIHKYIPPLYPLFLAFCYFIGGFNTLAYFIPQLILSSLTCVLIYLITSELFNKMVTLFAGFLVAFNLDLIFWASFVRTETLFIFLLALHFLLLIKGNSRRNFLLIYLSAVIFGLACLTRITLIPFLPILFFWQVCFFSKNRKESFKVALLMVLIIAAVLLPWGLRNYIVFGEFNIFSEESGILVQSVANGEQYKDIAINKEYDSNNSLILKILVFIKDNFKVYLISCWHRFVLFWSPFTYAMRPLAKVYKGLSWFMLFPAAFWGMIISRNKGKRGTGLIIIFIFYHALLHTASFVDLGLVYRYPIQPFLCIFAAYTFYELYKRIRNFDRNG